MTMTNYLNGDLAIISGSSNLGIAEKIAQILSLNLVEINLKKFSDNETNVKILDSVRGKDVFVIQSTSDPVNDHLMELIFIIDALKRSSARRITAVIPYYGYARQDRKVEPRVPISARVVADLLQVVGVDRILSMDLHADQIQGFFSVPVDHLFFSLVLTDYLLSKKNDNFIVVSPDSGGAQRARVIAKILKTNLAIIDKRRQKANESEVMNVIGDVNGRDCIIIDDLVDTAGSVCKASLALLEKGAKSVYCCATHGVLSGGAVENLNSSHFEEIIFSDTIYNPKNKEIKNMKILSVSEIFAEAIKRINLEGSLSELFD